jgi:hypothetical protein
MFEAFDNGPDTMILTDEENNIIEVLGFKIFCIDERSHNSPNN